MSRIRDLLMDRVKNPKPIAHWDFSKYKDSDMTASVNYVKDLTGNGYDLRLNNFDFSTNSGFEGYAQDFNKVNESPQLVSKSKNVIKIIRTEDYYASNISKDKYNNTTYVVKVSLPESVSDGGLVCACYVGDNYANYGLSSDRQIQTLVNGINVIQPFSDEYFNNAQHITFFPNVNTDEPCIIEQFPLNPFSLVFNNSLAVTKKALALPVQKGFTFIANRKYLDKTIRTILWGKYLTGGGSGYIIGDYTYRQLEDYKNYIYVYGNGNNVVLDFSEVEDGISWFSDKLYNGEIALNKGTDDDLGTSPLCIGDYTKESPDTEGNGYGHYAISEAWVFNKTLTKEQVEKFIAENATPLPQVYYDVEKQGTLNSDTNKDKIIDFSGNGNHGVLNNFDYTAAINKVYFDDEFPLTLVDSSISKEGHVYTLGSDISTVGSWLLNYKYANIPASITTEEYSIKVTGLQEGQQIEVIPWGILNSRDNEFSANRVTITHDGVYNIPSDTTEVPQTATVDRVIQGLIWCDATPVSAGLTIEYLPKSVYVDGDGWVETYIDDEFPMILNPTNKGDSTYGSHILSLSNNLNGWVLMTNFLNYDFQVRGFTVKVSGMSESQYIDFRTGSNFTLLQISSDGIYEVPSYDAKSGWRTILISCTANGTGTVEFLPRTDYIQFDGNNDNITIPTVTKGFKTVLMISETQQNNNERGVVRLYEQRKGTDKTFSLISYDVAHIAYNSLSTGETFINGILNTTIVGRQLKDHRICVAHRNNDVSADNSKSPVIGAGIADGNNGPFRISKFLGFSEYLSDTQIKKVIDKYGLMEGVNPVIASVINEKEEIKTYEHSSQELKDILELKE